MKKLYRYTMDCRRQGRVVGLFVADDSEVKEAMGKEVYFGEILGKHSDVSGTLSEDEFKVLTDDQDFIDKFLKFECHSGYNPLHYLSEDRE